MAHLRAAVGSGGRPNSAGIGFDSSRNLLVLPSSGDTDLFLVAGADLRPELSGKAAAMTERPATKAEKLSAELTGWERTQDIRVFRFRGVAPGDAVFNAFLDSRPFITPLMIRVTNERDHRQAGESPKGEVAISAALRLELAGLTFRDALVRLADDQMNSAIGRDSKAGFGRYGLPEKDAKGNKINWCGAFVHWLYKVVSSCQNVANPYGRDVNSLASPQKAIGYALHRQGSIDILRFAGPDPYGWSWPTDKTAPKADPRALVATYREIDDSMPIQGDICLVRVNNDPKDGWKHVCMVLSRPDSAGNFTTIDGNQGGTYNITTKTFSGSIGRNSHNANDKAGSVYKFVFLHARNLPGDDLF